MSGLLALRPAIRRLEAEPTACEQCGMAWWNGMTEAERLAACRAADTAIPAMAYAHWCKTSVKPNCDVALARQGASP